MEYTKLLGKVTLTTEGLHDSSLSYDRLCLVHDDTYRSFISIKDVPVNISIDNRAYWQPLNIVSADDEDLMIDDNLRLKFADKEYDPLSNSGMGYKILRKRTNNILTQDDFSSANTLYVIEYDFYLANKSITIPSDCAVYFKGGTINAGTVIGSDTILYGTISRKGNAEYEGTWVKTGTVDLDIQELKDRVSLLERAVFPYKLTVSGGGVFKKGIPTSVTINWAFTQSGISVLPDTLAVNGEELSVDQTAKTYLEVERDIVYNVVCVKEDMKFTGSASAVFVNPSYFGIVPDDFIITESNIKSLSSGEIIKNSKSYSTQLFTQQSQKNCYAYPKSFGLLTNIRDTNNQDLNNSYSRTEIQINGEQYYVYLLTTTSSVVNYKINFN